MKISKYSYIKEPDELLSGLEGEALCRALTVENLKRNSVKGISEKGSAAFWIEGGALGLDFSQSSILEDGKTVELVAEYRLRADIFGLSGKSVRIRQCAKTLAWLPPEKGELSELYGALEDSIWKQTNFVRGKFFANKIKEENKGADLRAGQGLDLFFEEEGRVSEIHSMNLFAKSYSQPEEKEEQGSASSYRIKEEAVRKELFSFAELLEANILKARGELEMEDGGLVKLGDINKKELILVLPKEAEQNENFLSCLSEIKEELQGKGIGLRLRFYGKAL